MSDASTYDHHTCVGALWGGAAFVEPCVCLDSDAWDLERTIDKLPAALVVRIVVQHRNVAHGPNPEMDVDYLDTEVVHVIKGLEEGVKRVRIWDSMFGTDCTAALSQLSVGDTFAVALDRPTSEQGELFTLLHISPAADDFLLGSCAIDREKLTPGRPAAHFAERQRKRLRKATPSNDRHTKH